MMGEETATHDMDLEGLVEPEMSGLVKEIETTISFGYQVVVEVLDTCYLLFALLIKAICFVGQEDIEINGKMDGNARIEDSVERDVGTKAPVEVERGSTTRDDDKFVHRDEARDSKHNGK